MIVKSLGYYRYGLEIKIGRKLIVLRTKRTNLTNSFSLHYLMSFFFEDKHAFHLRLLMSIKKNLKCISLHITIELIQLVKS